MRVTFKPAISAASLMADLWASEKFAGTDTTASAKSMPVWDRARSIRWRKINAPTYSGGYFSPSTLYRWRDPIFRFTEAMVRSGNGMRFSLASRPTITVPSSLKCTTEGVFASPASFRITQGCSKNQYASFEFVVPKSMPKQYFSCAIFLSPRGYRGKQFGVNAQYSHFFIF